MGDVKIAWGMNAQSRMVHIKDVERGKACNCICPDCEQPLVAKQGRSGRQVWHFSHFIRSDCGGMSALHLAAQQLLEDAAKDGKLLKLPVLEGACEAKDLRNVIYRSEWKIDHTREKMVSARQEAVLSIGLRTDVLVELVGGVSLGVEIHVTNKKSYVEAEKYSIEGLDCVEIDLSNLSWDSSPEDIEKCVLDCGDRNWINKRKLFPEYSRAKEAVEFEVRTNNKLYLKDFKSYISEISRAGTLRAGSLIWPYIKGEYRPSKKYYKPAKVLSVKPEVCVKGAIWEMGDLVAKVQGACSVNRVGKNSINKSPVTVAVIVYVEGGNEGVYRPLIDESQATLLIDYHPNLEDEKGVGSFRESNPFWVNIDGWVERLTSYARDEFEHEERTQEEARREKQLEIQAFRKKTSIEKLRELSDDLGVVPPQYAGKLCDCWNTTWNVWKTLVWKKWVIGSKNRIIACDEVANDAEFEILLEFNSSESEMRSRTVWWWLKDLEDLDVVAHTRGLEFIIHPNPPRNYQPWLRTNKPKPKDTR